MDQNAIDAINAYQNQGPKDDSKDRLMSGKPIPPTQRNVNNLELDNHEQIEQDSSDINIEQSEGQSTRILDMIKGEEEAEAATIAGILSAYTAQRAKAKVPRYPSTKQVKFNVLYRVSNHSLNAKTASLIDRGANGGLAGDDVRILNKTG